MKLDVKSLPKLALVAILVAILIFQIKTYNSVRNDVENLTDFIGIEHGLKTIDCECDKPGKGPGCNPNTWARNLSRDHMSC